MKEDKIQMQIVSYLRKQGYEVFSIPNEAAGKIKSRSGLSRMARLKAMGLRAGASDLVVLGNDLKIWFIEVKDDKGKQSEKQKDFQKEVESRGFTYLLFRSLDDALKYF